MPVDEQYTRSATGRHDPKSPHEATPEATQGEFGVPPTVKQSTKPTARAPISSPPPSLARKIDASSSKTRPQAADDLEPAILTNRTGGQALIAKQRREAVSISVADSAKRLLNSLYTTDVFTFTDTTLVEWFRKDNFERHQEARSAVPFFSTPSLAELMLKDKQKFRRDMETCQASIATADGPELEELLIVLTEIINEYFSPSAPTLIKLSIYFLTNTERITDNMLIGLDDGSSKVGLTTTFIENYYQVYDDDLSNFQLNECAEGKFEERSTLGGDYESAPGYQRLCAQRQVFTSENTAAAYDETWLQLWTMLKSVLCSHSEITPDIDLARRRRIINGNQTHPLRQQFTASGLEPDRVWLDRYRRADSAALDFERRVGFKCELDLDDMGHIGVATDALHECLHDLFDAELVKLGADTIKVPRTNYAGVLNKDRLLPKISWQAWKTAYCAAYKAYKAQINKKTYPCTKSSPIVSRMAERSTPSDDDSGKNTSGSIKPKACRWCKSTEHNTCDCPSEGRRTAGICKAYQRGKCRQGATHCKYRHTKDQSGLAGQSLEANLTANGPQSGSGLTNSGEKSQNPIGQQGQSIGQQGSGTSKSAPECTDDFTKPADRICNVPDCGKPFHLSLDGEYGVKWYGEKGMFLPRRCAVCIKAGKTKGQSNAQKPYNSNGGSQTQMCDMHDPEAVDTMLCGFDPAVLDLTNRFQKLTVSWCSRCGAHFELEYIRSNDMLCDSCSELDDSVRYPSDDELVITPPPAGSSALMIELSDSSAASSLSSQLDLDADHPVIPAPDAHSIHTAILSQWSGLELHPSAFTTACDTAYLFFVDGCSDSEGSFAWDGSTVNPTGETVSRLFKLICRSPHSEGITTDQLELAYGLGSALCELTSPHWFVAEAEDDGDSSSDVSNGSLSDVHAINNSQPTPPHSCMPESPDSNSSSNGSFSAQQAAEVLARAIPLCTAAMDATGVMAGSIAQTKGQRTTADICRFEPSPTGIKQDAVSDDEFHAAVMDSDLEDASIGSGNSDDLRDSALSDFR